MISLSRIKRLSQIALTEPAYLGEQIRVRLLQRLNLGLSNLSGGYSFALRKLWLVLTYRCNLRCKMCGQWGEKGRSKEFSKETLEQELSLEELKKVIDDVSSFKPSIMLMGGEPLLYKDWHKLAKYIKEKKLRSEMTTNGMLLKENALEIVKNIDNLNVSLDGPPKVNDEIRGVKGAFWRVIEGIKLVNETKKRLNAGKPYLNICCTISSENYQYLKEMVNLLEKERISLDLLLFQHLEFVNLPTLEENEKVWEEEFGVRSDYWRAISGSSGKVEVSLLLKEIAEVRRDKSANVRCLLFEPDFNEEEIRDFYKGRALQRFKQKCFAPWLEAFIYPEGNVWSCPGLVMGNVGEESLKTIWNEEKFRHLRRVLNQRKFFPVCSCCANHWHNWSG